MLDDTTMLTRRQLLAGAVPVGIAAVGAGKVLTSPGATPSADVGNVAALAARVIEGIYPAPALHWVGNGFHVAGYFSSIAEAARKLDPFLLLDYHPEAEYAPSARPRGVGVHPHRGFETVTLAWQGSVAHHDSAGGGGIIGPGDVQWMTAASGVLHKEYHERTFSQRGGTFQMAQLWVNLPRALKMAPPRYQPIVSEQMGLVTLPDAAGTVRVIAGEHLGVRGPAQTFTPIRILDARLRPGGRMALSFPAKETTAILVISGEVRIHGDRVAHANDFVLFGDSGEHIDIVAGAETQLLVLNGERIGEPVVQHGPFVMNTRAEIAAAYQDLQGGKFGHLDD
jgi:quercetin 2,3-dioxygenase